MPISVLELASREPNSVTGRARACGAQGAASSPARAARRRIFCRGLGMVAECRVPIAYATITARNCFPRVTRGDLTHEGGEARGLFFAPVGRGVDVFAGGHQ